MSQPPATDHLMASRRDPAELAAAIGRWLDRQLPGASPSVTDVSKPDGNGMSSDTILFKASWQDGDETVDGSFVARVEPELDDLPVFPSYDLDLQYRVMALVGDAGDVPVPALRWFEGDADAIGAPFFVMDRVTGLVPPDVLPYTFPDDNWVMTATDEQRDTIVRSAVRALAGIHRIGPETHDLSFLELDTPGATELERHLAHWEAYKTWVTADAPSDLLDDCFTWLRDNLPTDLGPARLSWGDARIGNMLFADFEVAGVLDWEMAGIAPPEIDLGWMAYLHRFFQDLTTDLGAPGLPDMFRPADVVAAYADAGGGPVGDLRWPMAYAAMRHGVIMRRVGERMIAFGEREPTEDLDELVLHAGTLHAMLAGTYWPTIGL